MLMKSTKNPLQIHAAFDADENVLRSTTNKALPITVCHFIASPSCADCRRYLPKRIRSSGRFGREKPKSLTSLAVGSLQQTNPWVQLNISARHNHIFLSERRRETLSSRLLPEPGRDGQDFPRLFQRKAITRRVQKIGPMIK